jgi:basic membrane protein A
MSKTAKLTACAALGVVLLAGCAQPPQALQSSASPSAAPLKACLTAASGTFEDKGLNESAADGLQKAGDELGVATQIQEPSGNDGGATDIKTLIDGGCTLIIGVGSGMRDSITAAAGAHPELNFGLVGTITDQPVSNVKPIVFNTDESSFLAGYLAAATSKSGTVATFGAQNDQDTTIFMDGFAQGVSYFNTQKSASVKLLGWDVTAQSGSFLTSADPQNDAAAAQTMTQGFLGQGADVIFPIAGASNTGVLQAIKAAGNTATVIWPKVDGCSVQSDSCSLMLTSVIEDVNTGVYQVISDTQKGSFSSDPWVGTLLNGGTSIGDYNDQAANISEETKAEVEKLQSDISGGTIKVTSVSAYRVG